MEDRPLFDRERVDGAIAAVCDRFDELGLTLFERFWVSFHIALAALHVMGLGMEELREKYPELFELGGQDGADSVGNARDEGVSHAEGPVPVAHAGGPALREHLDGV